MWKTEIGGIKNTRSDCHRKWVDKSSTNQNCVRTEVLSQQTITKNTFLNSLYYLPKLSWKWKLIRSICMWMCAGTIRIALSNYFDVILTYEILMQVNLFINLYQSKLIFFNQNNFFNNDLAERNWHTILVVFVSLRRKCQKCTKSSRFHFMVDTTLNEIEVWLLSKHKWPHFDTSSFNIFLV